jgi:large subunit ribosomal protein L29
MKWQALREKTRDGLEKDLQDTYEQQAHLRSQLVSRQLTNTKQIRKIRQSIARLKTLLKEKDLSI